MRIGQERFQAIEGARALLALWVVFGHLLQQAGLSKQVGWPLSIIAGPDDAVRVFIIISGFVIAHLVTTTDETYGTYIIRRWLRLFPLLACCIGFIVLFSYLVSPKFFTFDKAYIWEYLTAYSAMAHGAIPHEWLPRASKALLSPAWSVSLEWQFYLVAPFLIKALMRTSLELFVPLFAAAALVAGSRLTLGGQVYSFPGGSFLPLSLVYFLVGIGSYFALEHARRLPYVSILALLSTAAAIVWFTSSYVAAAWPLVYASLCVCPGMNQALTIRPLLFLGRISFSIYLVHLIVLVLLQRGIVHRLFVSGTWPYFFALALLTIPATIILSSVTYRWIEEPFIRLGKARLPYRGKVA
jgi:peptidoglycan/LPS O-acetylase OafA/YrhL